MKNEILEATYQMVNAFTVVQGAGKLNEMADVLEGLGYDAERITTAIKFLQANLTPEEIDTYIMRESYIDYMKSIDKLEKHMKMAKGYQEMGDINLEISQDSFHAEEEGEKKVYEVVTEKSESDTEAG